MASLDSSERRTVAILFAGVAGLDEAAPTAEKRGDTLDGLFRRFREIVEARGGVIDKFVGDTAMAVFGAPLAHGDDAARAVRAAIELRRAFAGGSGLALRAGVNFGEVLWGGVGGDRATAIGDVVNVAQRLRVAAGDGEVLVSAAVRRAVAGALMFGEARELAVKGRSEPVEASAAIGEAPDVTEVRSAAPMAGRDHELNLLLELLQAGVSAFIILEGEAGIGKTRLMSELRSRARAAVPGLWVGSGRALESSRLPMTAFADLLRSAAGSPDPVRVAAWAASELEGGGDAVTVENQAHLMALSAGFDLPGTRVGGLAPERRDAETALAWRTWLDRRLTRGPIFLCFEDLHWADADTIALLENLADRAAGHPVTILCSTRPGATRLPKDWRGVRLGTLSREAAARVAGQALACPASPDLLDYLFNMTGGHPYYIFELARWLKSSGLVSGSPATLTRRPNRLPEGLLGLLVARVDALPPAEKEALKAASVVGQPFWSGVLAETLGRDVSDSVARAAGEDLVVRRAESLVPGEAEWAFRHALVREAAYSLVTKRDRARLHGSVAEALLSRGGGRRVRGLAAGHREASGDTARAGEMWEALAQEAARDHANPEAAAGALEAVRLGRGTSAQLVASRALAVLGRHDEALEAAARVLADPAATVDDRVRARLDIANVEVRSGRTAAAIPSLDAALAEAPAGPARVELLLARARARLEIARFADAASDIDAAEAGLAGSAPHDTLPRLRATLLNARATLAWRQSRCADSARFAEAAIAAANESGERTLAGASFGLLGIVRRILGQPDAARAALDSSIEIFRLLGDRRGMARAHHNTAILLADQGDVDTAYERFGIPLALYRELGDLPSQAEIHIWKSHLDFNRKRHDDGERAVDEAARCLEGLDRPDLSAMLKNSRAQLMRIRNRPAEAVKCFEEALADYQRMKNRWASSAVLFNLGDTHARQGDLDAAARRFEESLAIRREIADPASLSSTLAYLGDVRRRRGDRAGAEAAWEEAFAIASAARANASLGVVHAFRAEAFLAEGKREEALREAGAGLPAAQAAGDRPMEARLKAILAGGAGGEILE